MKELTGSNAAAGSVFLMLGLPSIFSPLFGPTIDRFPRRKVLIVNDLITGAVVLSLLAVHDRSDIWIIYAVAVVYGVALQVGEAARAGLLVTMLQEGLLGQANGFLTASAQGVRLAAPLLGAGLFAAFGGGFVAVFDAATFALGALFLMVVRATDITRSVDERPSFLTDATAGIRHIWRSREIRRLVAVTVGVVAVLGTVEVAVFAMVDDGLHKPPTFLGVLATLQGVGSIAAGLLAGRAIRRFGEIHAAAGALLVGALGFVLFVSPSVPKALVGCALFGVAIALFEVAYMTLLQRRTESQMQGRVFTAAGAVIGPVQSLSIAMGAALIGVVGFQTIYAACAVAMALGAIALSGRSILPDVAEPLLVHEEPGSAD